MLKQITLQPAGHLLKALQLLRIHNRDRCCAFKQTYAPDTKDILKRVRLIYSIHKSVCIMGREKIAMNDRVPKQVTYLQNLRTFLVQKLSRV